MFQLYINQHHVTQLYSCLDTDGCIPSSATCLNSHLSPLCRLVVYLTV